MLPRFKFLNTLFLLAIINLSVQAQKKELGNDQYFKNNFTGIIQPLPVFNKWIDDTHFILLRKGSRFTVDARTGEEIATVDESISSKSIDTIKGTISTKEGNLFFKINGKEIQLTNDKDKKSNATLSPDNKYVAFTKNNDLYTIEINSKKVNRLTSDGSKLILNGYASWVYMEEILGRSSQYRSYWWSPDSKKIAFFRSDDTKVPEFVITNAKGLHGEVEYTHYPKVGDPNPSVKIGIISPKGGTTVWTKINEKQDQYFGMPYWKPDGSALLVQWMPRSQDQLKIYEVNPTTGNIKEFYSEEQKTWVKLTDDGERISFLKNGKGFILSSDKTGWKHLYYYSMNGKLINPITTGNFTVNKIEFVDESNQLVYFSYFISILIES